jgi:2-methylcitrate dehydratase PrpD
MTDPVTAQFAQLISKMAVENMPVAATEQIRWRVLKALATILSADINPRATVPHTTINGTSSGPPAAHDTTGYIQNQPVLSALSTGAMLDIRQPGADGHSGFMAVDAAIIAAAWALAQTCQSSGHVFMSALAAGYLATALLADLPDIDYSRAWRAGAVSGTVGAAVAAARANQLAATATLDAMGFAAAQAAQLEQNAATAAQTITNDAAGEVCQEPPDLPGPGRAAMDGVLSAHMATLGGHCPPALIEQLQLAMGTVNLDRALPDAWAAVQRNRPCTGIEAIRCFRKQVAPVISDGEAETIIGLILHLEHTAPGELTTYVNERIGTRLGS